jgi:tetratricopeptide (TPR) repeat protein
MAHRRFCFFVVFLLNIFFGSYSNAQNHVVDSLKTLLENPANISKPDTGIMRAAQSLTNYYSRISCDSSKYFAQLSYQLAITANNQIGIAMGYNMLGIAYSHCGNYDRAIVNYGLSLEILKKLGNKRGIAHMLNNIGVIYKNKGDYKKALDYYWQNKKIAEEIGDPESMVIALNNFGILYYEWGKYELALENYENAVKILEEKNDKVQLSVLLNNIGELYSKLNQDEKALAYYDRVLKISQEINNKKGIINTYSNSAVVQMKMGNFNLASDNLQKALSISEELGNKVQIAEILVKLALVNIKLANFPKAKINLDKSLDLSSQLSNLFILKDANQAYYDYYEAINNKGKALEYYKKYIQIKDSLFNVDSRKEIEELRTKYETEVKEQEISNLLKEKEINKLEIEKQKLLKYYLIFAILFIMVVSLLMFNRFKLKKKNEKNEIEKSKLEIEQRLLRSQMNPHFIFNSMNSINSFITDNDASSAQLFLSKFSRLIRYILENSREPFIPFQDEMNTLELYLELEQLRFENKFSFSIVNDFEENPEDILIPPMFIQPFIENAIIHGIQNKKGKGHISIELKIENNQMLCIIKDDGIGREKAASFKNKKAISHDSLGIKVINERLEILGLKMKGGANVLFSDLKDDKGNPSGTLVELRIPFELDQ